MGSQLESRLLLDPSESSDPALEVVLEEDLVVPVSLSAGAGLEPEQTDC